MRPTGTVGLLFAIAASAALCAQSAEADWVERPYSPPVGSRWIIQRDLSKEEVQREDGRETAVRSVMKITSELTVEAKTPSGYRISYRRTRSSYSDNTTNAAANQAVLKILDNVPIHATTDGAGRPLRVENLDDMRKAISALIDRMAASAANAQVAAGVRQLLDGLTKMNAEEAARGYLDEIPALAIGQNTGLKSGEVRRGDIAVPNGIGPPMVKKTELSIVAADPASGEVRYKLAERYDEDSVRAFLVAVAKVTGRDPNDMNRMKISLENQSEIKVVDGITRSLHEQSTTSANLMGNTRVTRYVKDVTVAPAR